MNESAPQLESGAPGAGSRRFRVVVFDCDSTLSAVEGIDELAAGNTRVRELTELAMNGTVPLEEVYARRMELVRPDRAALERLATLYMENLVPDAREVVGSLNRAGVEVHIMSGGVRQALLPLAAELGVASARVHAVDVWLDEAGDYAGFDSSSPLARARGKRALLESMQLARPLLFVGDGATDLEVSDVVDLFVACAGIVDRPSVTAAAAVVLTVASLAPLLPLVLPEVVTNAADRAAWEKGASLSREGALRDRTGEWIP